MRRTYVASLAALALVTPAAAQARLGLQPRLGAGLVIEDGPPGTDATAVGTAYSVGLGVGVPLLSVVGDLGFRSASVPTAELEKGWTQYATRDTVFTLGLRSQLTFLDLVRTAGELHLGRSWADHRAAAAGPVYRYGKPDEYLVLGGAVEASYLFTKRFSLGARFGVDRFLPQESLDDPTDHEFAADFERTSYTAALLLGIGL